MLKKKTVGIARIAILVETSTSWGRQIVAGILNYSEQNGPWHLFIEPWGLEESLAVPKGWKGDGIIACVRNPKTLAGLKSVKCPIVNISGVDVPGANFPRVTTDSVAAARIAAEFFLRRGFRNGGYFGVRGISYVRSHQRSFESTLKSAGATCSTYSVFPHHGAEPDWNLNRAQLIDWLKNLPKPVGILTWNASGSREILYAAHDAGFLVPEDIAVLSGTDDELFCKSAYISISGIRPATHQIGHQAAVLLDKLMRGKKKTSTLQLFQPLGITERQSTDTLAIQDAILLKAIRYIRANAHRNLRVTEVVKHASTSRRALEIRFAEQLQRTLAQEIRRTHVEKACELLEQTDLPMPDVAEGSGFSSAERLAIVFRKEMRQPPLRYRKQIRSC
jgi:LacI family transcriptional regulator